MTTGFGQIIINLREKPLSGMVMTEVHLYKRTDGGQFKNSMEGSEESGYGNLVKKCQALITSPHSKSFLAGLLGSDFSPLLPANHLQSPHTLREICQHCPFM